MSAQRWKEYRAAVPILRERVGDSAAEILTECLNEIERLQDELALHREWADRSAARGTSIIEAIKQTDCIAIAGCKVTTETKQ